MPTLSRVPSASHWQQRLDTLAGQHRMVGASLGILSGDDVRHATYGTANSRAGNSVRPDTVFQLGSITKVFTATAIQRLALDLHQPVSAWLPDLRQAGRVTLRHLLTHTSGIAGDIFTDTGRGDDALERYVNGLDSVPPTLPPGTGFSYCNSGFCLLGRVIETVTGKVWDEAMRDLIIRPLGLEHTMTLPEEAILHSAAVGHVRQADGTVKPVARWGLPRSMGPAGGIISTAGDVLTFARFHLDAGDRMREMQAAQTPLPFRDGENDSLGLAWFRQTWDGIGHDGDTVGQSACLRILPSQRLAVVLLTNGGPARDLYRSLFSEIFAELAGISMPPPLQPPSTPPAVFDLDRHAGLYRGYEDDNELLVRDGSPVLRWSVSGSLVELMPAPAGEYETVVAGPDLLLYREPGQDRWRPATFVPLADGRPGLYLGLRAYPRVS